MRPSLCRETSRTTRAEPSDDFTHLVAHELPGMLRVARGLLGSDDLAWDAVQETLLRIWRRPGSAVPSAGALRHLTELSALHLMRCERRRRFHEDQVGREDCCSEDPLAGIVGAERRDELRAVLADMTEPFRRVLELYELCGREYGEIARELDIPIGTVRSRLARARGELRQRLRG